MKTVLRGFKVSAIAVLMLLFCIPSEGQILNKIGKKIERSVERRVDRKIDRGVEKSLDKVEEGVDETAKEAVSKKDKNEPAKKDQSRATTPTAPMTVIDESPFSEAEAEKARSGSGMVLVTANCDDFAWFRKGAVIEYEIKMPDEKDDFNTKMVVNSVRKDGGKTIANVTASGYDNHELEVDYICAGNKMYFDFTTALRSQLRQMGGNAEQTEVSFEGGLMEIPKSLYPGQKLQDVVFTMTATTPGLGGGGMVVTSYLTDRKVEKREQVTTPAGTFNTMKITGKRSMKMHILGSERNMGKPATEEVWFAPKVGVVKSVSKDHKGKIDTEQRLVRFEH